MAKLICLHFVCGCLVTFGQSLISCGRDHMVCEARRIFCVAAGPSVCPGVVRWLHSVRTDNLTQSGPVVLYSAVLAHTPTIQVQKLSLAWYSQNFCPS